MAIDPFFGTIAGAAIGGGLGIGGSALSASAARRAAKRAYQRQVRFYKNRYQWQMEDMKSAGLNPILAYQTGAPGSPGAPVARTYDFGPHMSEMGKTIAKGAVDAYSAKSQKTLRDSQKTLADEQVNVARSAAERNVQEQKLANARTINQQLQNTLDAMDVDLFKGNEKLKRMKAIATIYRGLSLPGALMSAAGAGPDEMPNAGSAKGLRGIDGWILKALQKLGFDELPTEALDRLKRERGVE